MEVALLIRGFGWGSWYLGRFWGEVGGGYIGRFRVFFYFCFSISFLGSVRGLVFSWCLVRIRTINVGYK